MLAQQTTKVTRTSTKATNGNDAANTLDDVADIDEDEEATMTPSKCKGKAVAADVEQEDTVTERQMVKAVAPAFSTTPPLSSPRERADDLPNTSSRISEVALYNND